MNAQLNKYSLNQEWIFVFITWLAPRLGFAFLFNFEFSSCSETVVAGGTERDTTTFKPFVQLF
jgi:hypothetical protein